MAIVFCGEDVEVVGFWGGAVGQGGALFASDFGGGRFTRGGGAWVGGEKIETAL